ncbi:MAG: hypothetical protein NC131_20800 [Roseburia sp.]|nr:hypothetical protein [Roseburia sp.]
MITYEVKQGKSVTLITHRVVRINVNQTTGAVTYTTRGDNAPSDDGVHPSFTDIVGIYTGKSCAVMGYIVGFLQSTEGAVALIIIVLIFIFAFIMISYINRVKIWRNSALSALNKIRRVLSGAQVEELKTIADIVGIINKEPETKQELKRKDRKLEWFLITGALPMRPYNDDLCPTDAMSNNIEEKIPYLCYRYPQDNYGETIETENTEITGDEGLMENDGDISVAADTVTYEDLIEAPTAEDGENDDVDEETAYIPADYAENLPKVEASDTPTVYDEILSETEIKDDEIDYITATGEEILPDAEAQNEDADVKFEKELSEPVDNGETD